LSSDACAGGVCHDGAKVAGFGRAVDRGRRASVEDVRSVAILIACTANTAWADANGAWSFEVGAAADAAHASSDETTGELGGDVGLDYQLRGSECKTLELTQDAYWYRRGADSGASFDGGAAVCIDQVDRPDGQPGELVQFPRVIGGYDLRSAARPRFDAPATLHADEYSLYTVYFGFGVFERRDARRRLSGGRITTRADVTLQGVDATVTEPTQNLLSIDFAGFTAERERDTAHPLVIDIARAAFRYEGNHRTSLLAATPLSFAGWRRGSVRLAGDAGYTYAHALARRLHVLTGGAGIETDAGPLTLGLRYRRDVLPAVDPVVIVDDRVVAEAGGALLGGTLTVGGFAATSLAVSVRSADLDRRDVTGGGSLAVARPIGTHVLWRAGLEVGRSFYSRFDREMPEVATVARATTRLEVRLGR
jgi:hypothetical protein